MTMIKHLPAPIKGVVKKVLAQAGYAIVPSDPRQVAPSSLGMFFPTGVVKRGWDMIPDWTASHQHLPPWLEVLQKVYARKGSWPASISPEGGSLLYWLIRNIQPRLIVETGSFIGVSAIWMAAALEVNAGRPDADPALAGACIHAFDLEFPTRPDDPPLWRDRHKGMLERLHAAGLSHRFHLHSGKSAEQIAACSAQLRASGGVDLAYVDGDHTLEGVRADLLALEPVLNVGGLVILHDVFPSVCRVDGPAMLLEQLDRTACGRYEWCRLYTAPLNYGLAILRRIS